MNRPVAALAAAVAVAAALLPAPVAAEERCAKTYAEIYKETSDAVVRINATRIDPFRLNNRVRRTVGSGFIFSEKGLILTNSHVVFGAQIVTVTLDSGDTLPAKFVGADPIFDLAVIKIPTPDRGKLPTIAFGSSEGVRVGDSVVAIGNPFGLDQTLTKGIISAINRVLPDTPLSVRRHLLQTDAPINPGNSGGPLLDLCGLAIGINTEIIPDAQNLGFAVPIDLVKAALPSLIEKGRISRPWIGFQGRLVDVNLIKLLNFPLVTGLLIEVVEPESPAAKAGIRGGFLDMTIAGDEILIGGDIVTKINGATLADEESLMTAMDALKIGGTLELELYRAGQTETVKYVLPERPLLPGDVADE